MTKPQQPELARNRLGATDQNSAEIRAEESKPPQEAAFGKVPEENQPGHHPEQEQDKPTAPPA
jgi:hypothetical protein